jgi:hypothetical protein
MTVLETDDIKIKAIIDFFTAIAPAMDVLDVRYGKTYVQFEFDGLVYRIGDITGMSPAEVGNCIRDAIITGQSDYITDVRLNSVRQRKVRRRNGSSRKSNQTGM